MSNKCPLDDNCKAGHLDADVEIVKQLEQSAMIEQKYAGPKDFTHLHSHSLFSTLDGVGTPEDYIHRASQLGMTSFALTDHGSLAGLPDAYWAAKSHKIKFMAGCEIYLNDFHQKMKEFQSRDINIATLKISDPEFVERYRRNRHLTVICKNMTGYKNLIHLMKDAWELGQYGKYPRTWTEQLMKYREGLIVLSGCLNGPVCHELRRGHTEKSKGNKAGVTMYYKKALNYVKVMREIFGDDFYIELQIPGATIEGAREVFFQLSDISKKLQIPAVMTGDMHYLHRRDFELQKAMMAVEQNTTISDPNLFHVDSDEGFFKNRAQFREVFFEHEYSRYDGVEWFEKICDNTMAISEKCQPFQPDLSPKLPEIQDADATIQKLVAEGLIKRNLHTNNTRYMIDGKLVTYKEQAKIELSRIIEKKFSSYFLITRNLVLHAKDINCDVGPARGSAGGSLVCYLIDIHDMDPLKWGLSFDRFLSPSRGGFMLKTTI